MKMKISLALLTAITCAPGLWAQEQIEIVNQNGQSVGRAQVQVQAGGGEGNGVVAVGGERQVKIEGDRIIIVDENGETREIDIAGAKSVSVQQSVKTVNDNGQQRTVRQGKAIIITPDGERQVIELGDPIEGEIDMPQLDFQFDGFGEMPGGLKMFRRGLPGSIRVQASTQGKYMIGVSCDSVSDEIRVHLNLNEGVGLIVQSVSPDSPAAAAGLQKHDILMIAEDKELATTQDLVDVIQTVGAEGKVVNLTAIRGGQEISFKVTPAERPADQMQGMQFEGPDFQFQQFGPGIIIDGDGNNPMFDMKIQIEQMRQQMQEMENLMKGGNIRIQIDEQFDQNSDQDSDQDIDRNDG